MAAGVWLSGHQQTDLSLTRKRIDPPPPLRGKLFTIFGGFARAASTSNVHTRLHIQRRYIILHLTSANVSVRWIISLDGVPDTIYAGEHFELQVDFPEHYPMEAPQVIGPLQKGSQLLPCSVCLVHFLKFVFERHLFTLRTASSNNPSIACSLGGKKPCLGLRCRYASLWTVSRQALGNKGYQKPGWSTKFPPNPYSITSVQLRCVFVATRAGRFPMRCSESLVTTTLILL